MWQPSQESEEPKTISSKGWAVRNFQNLFQAKAKLSVGLESEKLNWKSSKRPKSVFPQCWSRTARLLFAYQTKTAWVLPMVMVLTWKSSIPADVDTGNAFPHSIGDAVWPSSRWISSRKEYLLFTSNVGGAEEKLIKLWRRSWRQVTEGAVAIATVCLSKTFWKDDLGLCFLC